MISKNFKYLLVFLYFICFFENKAQNNKLGEDSLSNSEFEEKKVKFHTGVSIELNALFLDFNVTNQVLKQFNYPIIPEYAGIFNLGIGVYKRMENKSSTLYLVHINMLYANNSKELIEGKDKINSFSGILIVQLDRGINVDLLKNPKWSFYPMLHGGVSYLNLSLKKEKKDFGFADYIQKYENNELSNFIAQRFLFTVKLGLGIEYTFKDISKGGTSMHVGLNGGYQYQLFDSKFVVFLNIVTPLDINLNGWYMNLVFKFDKNKEKKRHLLQLFKN